MANYSYLCATQLETTYPSFVDPQYDADNQTIACDVWCVPLLWFGLFRTADIIERTFEVDGESIHTQAPLAPLSRALAQFDHALPYFEKLLGEYGSLREHAALFREAILGASKPFLTIELQEIAGLAPSESEYYAVFRAALTGIENDFTIVARDRLLDLAQFRNLRRFPPARLLLDGLPGSDDDCWNHCRVAGAGANVACVGRPVPWEPK